MNIPLTDSTFYAEIRCSMASISLCAFFSFLETAATALRLFNLQATALVASGYRFFFSTRKKESQHVMIVNGKKAQLVQSEAQNDKQAVQKIVSSFLELKKKLLHKGLI